MRNIYFLAGRELTEVVEESAPHEGTEVCIDGQYYRVFRSIRHITSCPPWRTHVHLVVSTDGERLALPAPV